MIFKKSTFLRKRNNLIARIILNLGVIFIICCLGLHCKANSSDEKKKKSFFLYALIAGLNSKVVVQTGIAVVTTFADVLKVGFPMGVTIDPNGIIYLTDERYSIIRTITSSGSATVMAGSLVGGTKGYVDATGSAARFNSPAGIARDASGNLFITDSGNHAIRKITSSGVVTTFAGNGTAGYIDATGAEARFNFPIGVAVDGKGNVYVGDNMNNAIRKITSNSVVTTLAGNGTSGYIDSIGTAARFYRPAGMAVDGSDNVYVSDAYSTIRKIDANRLVRTIAGNENDPTLNLYQTELWIAEGDYYYSAGQYRRSLAIYEKAIEQYPSNPKVKLK